MYSEIGHIFVACQLDTLEVSVDHRAMLHEIAIRQGKNENIGYR